jgi:hypothetical protein
LKAQFAEERTKWEEANKQNLREHESLEKQNLARRSGSQGKAMPFSPAKPGGIISHLTAKCCGNFHEEAPMTGARDAVVFPGFVAKTPDTIKQKIYGYLVSSGSQSRKVYFTHCSGIFRLRGGSLASENLLKAAVPRKYVFTLDSAHLIAVDFAEDCQETVEIFFASSSRSKHVAQVLRLEFAWTLRVVLLRSRLAQIGH